ncbi:MAG TPA: arsinothricin resistance N-acetyltransferase ArsN1 family B [Caulobacteraceae bacterium]|nr:arsinothricin resistance N-acetyltransferase ArsN1 family B [Caulobacteraceae bacterium]
MTTGGSLEVRIARESDAAALAAIYAPIVTQTAISFETTPPSVEEMAERVRATLRTHPFLVADRGDEVAGYAYAGAHRARAAYQWSTDVTVYVAANARRGGIARRLYAALLATLEAQGFHAAFAGIALPYDPSVAVHEAVGFEPLGVYHEVGFKLGRWHDVGWWRRGLSASTPPAPPTPFAELAPGWRPP